MTPVTLAVAVLGFVVILVASLFVAAPLFAEAGPGVADVDLELERWERQKRQALAAIKEAEDDHRMGKLSAEDLAELRGRFEAQALQALAVLERSGR